MEKKLIFCIFSVVLLVQSIPAYLAKCSHETNVKHLFTEIVKFFKDFAKVLIADTKIVFNRSIDWEQFEPGVNKYEDELVAYLKREDELTCLTGKNRTKEFFLIVKQILTLVDKYTSENDDNTDTALKDIKVTLKNKQFEAVKQKYLIHFRMWKVFIDEQVKIFIESLTPSQKTEDSKLIEWFEKIQNETDLENKFSLFAIFFGINENDK